MRVGFYLAPGQPVERVLPLIARAAARAGQRMLVVADDDALLRIDWPRGFGMAHAFRLAGEVQGWREGGAWHVATPALRLRGDGLGIGLRGGLAWQGDGTRPRIDLAAAVDEAPLPLAKGFWARNADSGALSVNAAS